VLRSAAIVLAISLVMPLVAARALQTSGPPVTADEVVGAWAADVSHAGETARVILNIERRPDGRLVAKWSTPAIHFWEVPVGVVTLDGDTARIGSFVLSYDRKAATLTGTIPHAVVPRYSMQAVYHRVKSVDPIPRRALAAPDRRPAWAFDAGSPVWSDVAVCNGFVIAGDDGGRVHALEEETGRQAWVFDAGAAVRARATCAADAAIVHADDGFVTKLDVKNGTSIWKVRVDRQPIVRLALDDPKSRYDNRASAVTVAGSRGYVGTADGRVVSLDASTGAVIWEFSAGDSVVAAPLVAGARVFFGSFDGRVYAVDAASGAQIWTKDTGGAVTSTPVSFAGNVIVGSRSYDLTAFEERSGTPVWTRYFWFSWVESTAAIFKSTLYIGSSDAARVSAIDPSNGRQLWTSDVGGSAWGEPVVANDRVLVGAVGVVNYMPPHQGGAMALDRRTGHLLWRFAVEPPNGAATSGLVPFGFAGSPAIGRRLVYFGGLDGRVYAFTP
jgi:outer membrane protein assembly factor BamB